MKILLYLDPWVSISDKPEFKIKWLNIFLEITCRNMFAQAYFINKDAIEIKLIYSDIVDANFDKSEFRFIDFISIAQEELKNIFSNYEEYISLQHSKELHPNIEKFNQLISARLSSTGGDFIPDVIIPISTAPRNLEFLFPKALILFNENGIFARIPYPPTLYFECSSGMDKSFLLKFKNEIQALKINENEKEFLQKIRNYFVKEIASLSPFIEEIKELRKKFKHIVLLPLQVFESQMFLSQGGNLYHDQIEYLAKILTAVGDDIGVIVTEHDLDKMLVYEPLLKYFKSRYKNFIYLESANLYPHSSQLILSQVDGVISMSSTVGLQALLFKKPLFVPSKTSYLSVFSDEDDMSKIGDFLNNPLNWDKDAILYFLLTRYYVTKNYYSDGKWFYDFLKKSCERFKKGPDINFYDKIDSDENLLNIICNDHLFKVYEAEVKKCRSKILASNKKVRGLAKLKNSIRKRIKKSKVQ